MARVTTPMYVLNLSSASLTAENRIGDVVNDWRVSIDLEPIPATEGPCLADVLKVPFTYYWSPSLVTQTNGLAGTH